MDNTKLLRMLQEKRVALLAGIKPDAKARAAWNLAVQAITDAAPEGEKAQFRAFMLEVRID